jgi:hypothetical protein
VPFFQKNMEKAPFEKTRYFLKSVFICVMSVRKLSFRKPPFRKRGPRQDSTGPDRTRPVQTGPDRHCRQDRPDHPTSLTTSCPAVVPVSARSAPSPRRR